MICRIENGAVFHNRSVQKSSAIIREAEAAAFTSWIPNYPELRHLSIPRMFTYVDAAKLRLSKTRGRETCHYPPGRCFLEAGWSFVRTANGLPYRSTNGLFLL